MISLFNKGAVFLIDPANMKKFSEAVETVEERMLDAEVPADMRGQRLDQAAAQLFPDFSRARLQGWIRDGNLLLDGKPAKAKDKVLGGEALTLVAEVEDQELWEAEQMTLEIVFEDEAIIVINKPAGLVVHPAAGNRTGTLLNGLLYHCEGLNQVPRAGIVHRLDKDTSGLMVVAKTIKTQLHLADQLRDKSVSRIYQAVVCGLVTAGGTVDEPLGRHPVHRTRRAVSQSADAREAVTRYRIMKKFRSHTLLQCALETGRTHQIRVHMAYIGFPLVGDQLYGGRPRVPKGAAPELIRFIEQFNRQALHAWQLGLVHPVSGNAMSWQVELPQDMQELLTLLEEDNAV